MILCKFAEIIIVELSPYVMDEMKVILTSGKLNFPLK